MLSIQKLHVNVLVDVLAFCLILASVSVYFLHCFLNCVLEFLSYTYVLFVLNSAMKKMGKCTYIHVHICI